MSELLSIPTKDCATCAQEYELSTINGSTYFDNAHGLCDTCSIQKEEEDLLEKKKDKCRAYWKATVGAEYADTDPEHEAYNREIELVSCSWISTPRDAYFGEDEKKTFLGFIGDNGTCKTRYMSIMLKKFIWNDERFKWTNSHEFQKAVTSANRYDDIQKQESLKYLRSCSTVPVLFIDEVGALSSETADEFLQLVENRKKNYLPIIWTSNETVEEMFSELEGWDRKRIISKFSGNSNILQAS